MCLFKVAIKSNLKHQKEIVINIFKLFIIFSMKNNN